MKKNLTLIALMCGLSHLLSAQDTIQPVLKVSGYAEVFYAVDFQNEGSGVRPQFLYNHNRHNEFNANLALIKAAYADRRVMANVAIGVGTYMRDNYAAEPDGFRQIYEANIGLKLNRQWHIDAGIMPSHIGFESAVGMDCPTLTRSLAAENSPYFETGLKVTYAPSERVTLAALALNGWQRMARVNEGWAGGTQLTYKPHDRFMLNWSTYLGQEGPDTALVVRYFSNFYAIYQINERLQITGGFDAGQQNNEVWLTPQAILRWRMAEKWASALRWEQFSDPAAIVVEPDFELRGASINFDFMPTDQSMIRVEYRHLYHAHDGFRYNNERHLPRLTAAMAVRF